MILKKILLLSVCLYSSYMFGAKMDREVAESLKCTKMFPHFERRYQIPIDILHSIALKESGKAHSEHKIRVISPWSANVEGQGYHFDNKREAVAFVKQQLKMGKTSIDVGCMQINLKYHPSAFKSVEHAFEPRFNVNYGASFLRLKYDNLQDWHKAIAHYHSATPELGLKYRQDVLKIAGRMQEYKSNLKKYAFLNYKNKVQDTNIAHFNNAQYNNFLNSRPNQTKNVQVVSAKFNKSYGNRIRSNMMVPIPKYNKSQRYKS